MKISSTVSAIAALAACVSAHITMKLPTPYNPAPDTSPLSPGGSNYPCKASGSGLTVASQSTASVGSNIQMSFSGSAVHGGGSCQVSLSKDGASSLNANSEFKVIYSILGGCPGTDGSTVSYDVPIPADVPAGDYTFAWTWFNKIGNREMYMNCAPLTISGGSGTDATFNALPDMAVYNIASKNECKTVEGSDVQFPNPGQYVMTGAGFKAGQPTCDGTSAGTGSGGSGGNAPAGNAPAANPNTGNQGGNQGGNGGTPTTTANDGQYTGEGGAGRQPTTTESADNGLYTGIGSQPQVLAPGASSVTSTATTLATSAIQSNTVVPQPPVPVPTVISAPNNGSSNGTFTPPTPPSTGSGPSSGSGAACSPDGSVVCSADGAQFAICNRGKAVFMPVAAGTTCSNGAITKKKRDVAIKLPFLFKA